jgi:hypothetical protein
MPPESRFSTILAFCAKRALLAPPKQPSPCTMPVTFFLLRGTSDALSPLTHLLGHDLIPELHQKIALAYS